MNAANILVVEDEVIISMEIQERLKALDYHVVGTADTMKGAINEAREKQPDLCLMDIMLKGNGTGIDAAKIIAGEMNIPVIFMTAYSDMDTIQKAKEALPYGYLLKPIDTDSMKIAIEIVLFKHDMEMKLLTSEKKYKVLFENSDKGVFISNLEGKIEEANPAVYQLFGLDKDSPITGKYIYEFFDEENSAFKEVVDTASRHSSSANTLITTNSNNGAAKHLLLSVNLVKDNKGNNNFVEGMFSDVTAEIEREKALQKAKEAAEKASKIKDEFIAGVSHEIRTPVNNILSYASLLIKEFEGKLNSEIEFDIKTIKSSGDRLIRTIDMILNMSDLNAGTFEYVEEEIDIVDELLASLVDEFRERANYNNTSIKLVNNAKQTKIITDKYSVSQIMTNLIDNAIKFTHDGKIKIIVDNPTENNIIVSVVDTGSGISEDYLPQIFSAFSQEEEGYSRKYEGSGLGMALVKKYCDLIGAEIDVTSKKNQGSSFKVSIKSTKKIGN